MSNETEFNSLSVGRGHWTFCAEEIHRCHSESYFSDKNQILNFCEKKRIECIKYGVPKEVNVTNRGQILSYYLVVREEIWWPAKCEPVLPVALLWLSSVGTQIQLLMLYSLRKCSQAELKRRKKVGEISVHYCKQRYSRSVLEISWNCDGVIVD